MSIDPQVAAALINGVSTVLAAGIAALAASLIGKRFAAREKLQQDLNAAINDIEFLLAVEKRHCDLHKNRNNESNFLRVRKYITEQGTLRWSGQFTPGRVRSSRGGTKQAINHDNAASGGPGA